MDSFFSGWKEEKQDEEENAEHSPKLHNFKITRKGESILPVPPISLLFSLAVWTSGVPVGFFSSRSQHGRGGGKKKCVPPQKKVQGL